MDDDGITMVNWMYQWAHFDGTNTTDITGATAITYLLEDKDIGNAMVVKVSFTDDLNNPEGPLASPTSRFVGPENLIVSNTDRDTAFDINTDLTALTATTPKLAQGLRGGFSSRQIHTRLYRAHFRQHRRHGNHR